MLPFRVIVVEDGQRTTQLVLPLDPVPHEGDTIDLPGDLSVKVHHVISAQGLAGIVLTWRPT